MVLTTNLPFSEWTQVIPNARLCKALLDRITDRAHILETGTESYRFRRTAEKQKKGASPKSWSRVNRQVKPAATAAETNSPFESASQPRFAAVSQDTPSLRNVWTR